jgi:hypothetical protein
MAAFGVWLFDEGEIGGGVGELPLHWRIAYGEASLVMIARSLPQGWKM